ncbi:MAG: site-specific integrase [Muribaculaceae bacterium]|nr:site-specific integrase [Muribaculaceae bacterium]
MPVFKPVVRDVSAAKLVPVYIRITHNRKVAYLKTDKLVVPMKSGDGGFNDIFVSQYCANLIVRYSEILNKEDISNWSANDIKRFIEEVDKKISFTEFAEGYIDRMLDRGQLGNSRVYKAALKSLSDYLELPVLEFACLTRNNLERWIEYLSDTTKRAKSLYPISIRQMYRKALMLSMDAKSGIGKIDDPWVDIEIPELVGGEKRAIGAEECRAFFSMAIGVDGKRMGRAELGRDVAMMSLCLAGINSVDLYGIKKKDYNGDILRYNRSKTTRKRRDDAYFEIRVPEIIKPLFDKYRASNESEMLFVFSERYADAKAFNVVVNQGIKLVCEKQGIVPEKAYSLYTFRHTWATTAKNDCGATLPEVGFALNHSGALSVTKGYIKFDFSPAWRLNERVIDFIFFSTEKSKLDSDRNRELDRVDNIFRVSSKEMVYVRAYFRGEVLAEMSDIGFENVDEVIAKLAAKLPSDIPRQCTVHFRIKNIDKDKEVVLEKIRGRDF